MEVNTFEAVSPARRDDRKTLTQPAVRTNVNLALVKHLVERMKNVQKDFPQNLSFWIHSSLTGVGFPCPLQEYCGRM
jgi:hypothetical protein